MVSHNTMSQRSATLLLFLLMVCDIYGARPSNAPGSRRKRYLAFPNKASVVLTISLLKGIASDIIVGPTTKVVTIHELDVLFPLPHDPSPFELAQTALGQPPIYHQSHSRHRRDLYGQLEELFYLQGLNGRSCLMKSLCEANSLPQLQEEDLVHELLFILFSLPPNITSDIEEYAVSPEDCDYHRQHCPFSIFDMAFQWAHQFISVYNAS